MACQDILKTGSRHGPAAPVVEEGRIAIRVSKPQPGIERGPRLLPERQEIARTVPSLNRR